MTKKNHVVLCFSSFASRSLTRHSVSFAFYFISSFASLNLSCIIIISTWRYVNSSVDKQRPAHTFTRVKIPRYTKEMKANSENKRNKQTNKQPNGEKSLTFMTNVCQGKCHRDRQRGETWHQLVDIVIQVDIFRYFLSFVARLSNIIIIQTILCECSGWMWWMVAAVDIDDCLHKTFLYPAIHRHTDAHTYICIIILSLGSHSHLPFPKHRAFIFHFSRCWMPIVFIFTVSVAKAVIVFWW